VLNAAQRSRLLAIARDTWKSDGYSTGTTTAGPGRVHPDASVPRHSVAYPPHPSGATPLYRIADLTVDAVRRDGLADAHTRSTGRALAGYILTTAEGLRGRRPTPTAAWPSRPAPPCARSTADSSSKPQN
jgi:hypothetical protein